MVLIMLMMMMMLMIMLLGVFEREGGGLSKARIFFTRKSLDPKFCLSQSFLIQYSFGPNTNLDFGFFLDFENKNLLEI